MTGLSQARSESPSTATDPRLQPIFIQREQHRWRSADYHRISCLFLIKQHVQYCSYNGGSQLKKNCPKHNRKCNGCNVGWPALSSRSLEHCDLIIYKVILGLLPSYLQQNIFQKGVKNYGLRSQDYYLLSIPKVRTNMCKWAFSYAAPFDWINYILSLCLKELVSLNDFRCILKDLVVESPDCKLFWVNCVCKRMHFVVCVTRCAVYLGQDPVVNEILNLKSF